MVSNDMDRVGMYVARLVRELAQVAPSSIGLIGVRASAHGLAALDESIPRRSLRTPDYHSWIQLSADNDARAMGAGLVHFTNAVAPLICRSPYVLTVHDLSLVRMPGTHPIARWGIVPVNLAALARARTIIVPSRWTASELRRIGVSPRRIVVIHHAPTLADPSIAGAAPGRVLLERLNIDARRYVLYFGTLEPRKNIARLVAAFEALAPVDPGLRLVLAGAPGWRYRGIARLIRTSPARSRIVVTGYLPQADLAALIVHSSAVAYVSLYEGFGMPVINAMALGAAVVTSNVASLPEVAGGAAVLVNPRDAADIARGLTTAIGRRDELGQLGRERAQGRTWTDVAREHMDVYRTAL